MAHNQTNHTSMQNQTNIDPWVESGAMVYVALTVASMSAVIMCCVWFLKHRLSPKGYGALASTSDPETIELANARESDSEEEIPLDTKDEPEAKQTEDVFTLEHSASEEENELFDDESV